MTRAPELISVIIPALNRASVIGLQLDALAGQRTSRAFEVIVADNGSTDDTVAVAESYADRFPRFEVVDAGALRGASYPRNQGARRARGELLVFCDSDDIVHDAWLETMASAWQPGSIVAGRIYPLRLAPNAPRCENLLPATPRPVTRGFLPFADGGNLAISRHDLERVGGWEDSFHFSEDVELSWRAQQSGLDLIDGRTRWCSNRARRRAGSVSASTTAGDGTVLCCTAAIANKACRGAPPEPSPAHGPRSGCTRCEEPATRRSGTWPFARRRGTRATWPALCATACSTSDRRHLAARSGWAHRGALEREAARLRRTATAVGSGPKSLMWVAGSRCRPTDPIPCI